MTQEENPARAAALDEIARLNALLTELLDQPNTDRQAPGTRAAGAWAQITSRIEPPRPAAAPSLTLQREEMR
jgi:hypothetical protein